jgi:hypothetical protein
MSKEGSKEDLINDINRLLNKENKEEFFDQNHLDLDLNDEQEMRDIPPHVLSQMQNEHMQQQMQPQMRPQMQPQMRPQMQPPIQPQMRKQQQPQMHEIPPQVLAELQHQQMQKQLQLQAQQHAQQQAQQQAIHQMMQQNNLKNNTVIEKLATVNSGTMSENSLSPKGTTNGLDNIKDMVYMYRDPLVLFLLFSVILTPQLNSVLNKIPYASGASGFNEYPNYVGIVLRGLLLVGVYVMLKKSNVI